MVGWVDILFFLSRAQFLANGPLSLGFMGMGLTCYKLDIS